MMPSEQNSPSDSPPRSRSIRPRLEETGKFLAPPRPTAGDGMIACALTLLALAIRLWSLKGAQIGQDDIFTLIVTQLPARQMIEQLVADYVQPPLHYFLLSAWMKLFGFGVLAAQLLSLVFGVLAIPSLYYLARYLFDRRTATLASAFLAASGSAVFFSRYCRPYSQLQALILVASYFFVRSLKEGKLIYWCCYVGSCILILYTHYYGGFVILAHLAFAVAYSKRYRLKRSWVGMGALGMAASYIPWMTSGIIGAAIHHPKVIGGRGLDPGLSGKPTPVRLGLVIHIFNNGVHGYLTSPWWWTYVAGFLLFTAPVLWALWRIGLRDGAGRDQRRFREGLALCGLLVLVPLTAFAAMSALGVQATSRYVSFCAAPYYVLAAAGIVILPSRFLCATVIALNLAYSAFALRGEPYFVRDNLFVKDLTDSLKAVENGRASGDGGLMMPYGLLRDSYLTLMEGSPDGITMPAYRGRTDRLSFKAIPQEQLRADLSKCKRVWVISWRCGPLPKSSEPRVLDSTYTRIEEQKFEGFDVSLYSLKN